MIKTSLPTAIVYCDEVRKPEVLQSDIYFEEGLHEGVNVHWARLGNQWKNYNEYTIRSQIVNVGADLLICIGEDIYKRLIGAFRQDDTLINNKVIWYHQQPPDNILANDIVCQSTFRACARDREVYNNPELPFFTIFTGAYKSGERLKRAWQSIANQTYPNWEWVIIDDSPEDHTETYEIANRLAQFDDRVKVYRMNPISNGNVGEVKHRAASLGNGNWLLELDHDDVLISTLLEECVDAIHKYPDSGFIYTDVCEMYEDGEMKSYGMIAPNREWYGHPANFFNWSYSGHEWVEADGQKYLSHLYPEINPKTIRFNIGMPNHARLWRRDVYSKIGGHNRSISVADDYELIVKTFLETKFTHIRKMLYVQYNNGNSTVDNNSKDINRRARLIRDHYDKSIHQRILDLGKTDSCWIEKENRSPRLQNDRFGVVYGEEEQILNYIIE